MKFKVGDIVNITRSDNYHYGVCYCDNMKNLEVKEEADSRGDVSVWTKDKSDWHFVEEQDLELASVGDPNDKCEVWNG